MLKNGVTRPLWIKITGCGFAAVLVSCLSVGGIAIDRQSGALDERLRTELGSDLGFIEADIEGQKRAATGVALTIAGEPGIGDLFTGERRDELIARFSGNFGAVKSAAGLQLITFMSAGQTAIARIHTPDKFGDDVSTRRRMIGEVLKTGRLTTGIEPGLSSLSVFSSAPVMAGGRVVGVVDVGTGLATDYFERLKASLHADLAVMLLHGTAFERQNSTFPGEPPMSQAELKTIFEGGSIQRTVTVGGRDVALGGVVLKDFSGARIGVLAIASDVTDIVAAGRMALWSMVATTAAVALLVLGAFLAFARRLSSTIGRLTSAMGRLVDGDLSTTIAGHAPAGRDRRHGPGRGGVQAGGDRQGRDGARGRAVAPAGRGGAGRNEAATAEAAGTSPPWSRASAAASTSSPRAPSRSGSTRASRPITRSSAPTSTPPWPSSQTR